MANEEHLARLKRGVEAWNFWREKNPEVKIDLRRANLRRANLRRADLNNADLSHADLFDANLHSADLFDANLSRANLGIANLRTNLRGANLSEADLHRADLSDANLNYANLRRADLTDANLRGANLRGAMTGQSMFASVDLSEAVGLNAVMHMMASTIGTNTLFRSKGKTPDVFLRGCGLSDWQIVAAKLEDPDLTSEQVIDLTYEIARIKAESPIQINPIFISYQRTNSDFVEALEPFFDEKRLRYWRDVHDMVSGPVEKQIERAIEYNRIMLLVLSKDSVESDWVEWEVMKARELEKETKEHVLCPIALDDSWKISGSWSKVLRAQVEKYHILDFSEWEDEDALAAAFQKLIDGLGIYYPKDVAGATGQG